MSLSRNTCARAVKLRCAVTYSVLPAAVSISTGAYPRGRRSYGAALISSSLTSRARSKQSRVRLLGIAGESLYDHLYRSVFAGALPPTQVCRRDGVDAGVMRGLDRAPLALGQSLRHGRQAYVEDQSWRGSRGGAVAADRIRRPDRLGTVRIARYTCLLYTSPSPRDR